MISNAGFIHGASDWILFVYWYLLKLQHLVLLTFDIQIINCFPIIGCVMSKEIVRINRKIVGRWKFWLPKEWNESHIKEDITVHKMTCDPIWPFISKQWNSCTMRFRNILENNFFPERFFPKLYLSDSLALKCLHYKERQVYLQYPLPDREINEISSLLIRCWFYSSILVLNCVQYFQVANKVLIIIQLASSNTTFYQNCNTTIPFLFEFKLTNLFASVFSIFL